MKKIIKKIKKDTTVKQYSIHGYAHWERVADYGRTIAAHENVNIRIIILFAYFHDCMRHSDGTDPEHGPRAAKYITTLPKKIIGLDNDEIEKLIFACRHHTYEQPTEDLSIMACWDADRLDLGRVGIIPDPKRLFTQTAKEIACARLQS